MSEQLANRDLPPSTVAPLLAETKETLQVDDSAKTNGNRFISGLVAAMPITVAVVQAAGYGANGIIAGSAAAAVMSAEALASGGARNIIAGWTTATLQTVGATGSGAALSAGSIAAMAVPGAIAGALLLGGGVFATYKFVAHKPHGQEPKQSVGTQRGKWMVVTEEGIGNVRFYDFDSQEMAWRYFNDSWHARIILNEHGKEKQAGGPNTAALNTIRKQFGVSPHNSTNGFRPAWLVAGNVITLHNSKHKRYIIMKGKDVDSHDGKDLGLLPAETVSEQFTLVDAGKGEFALFSATHKLFMRMKEDAVNSGGGEKAIDEFPREWKSERFTFVDAGKGRIAIHSKKNNRFIKMDGCKVNCNGGPKNVESLPDSWASERFTVKLLVTAA